MRAAIMLLQSPALLALLLAAAPAARAQPVREYEEQTWTEQCGDDQSNVAVSGGFLACAAALPFARGLFSCV